jgi:hypothetical protein
MDDVFISGTNGVNEQSHRRLAAWIATAAPTAVGSGDFFLGVSDDRLSLILEAADNSQTSVQEKQALCLRLCLCRADHTNEAGHTG